MDASHQPGVPARRVRWKSVAKYALAFTGVMLLLWAIWHPENRVQWVLTGVLLLATWGVWLAVDHDDPDNRSRGRPGAGPPGTSGRGNPLRYRRD